MPERKRFFSADVFPYRTRLIIIIICIICIITITSTIIMTVIVRKPLEYHVGLMRYSSLLHLSIFIAPALVAAFLINVPKFLETELVWIEREEVGGESCYKL